MDGRIRKGRRGEFAWLLRVEKVMEQFPPADAAAHFEEHRRFTAAIRRSGRLAARDRSPPGTAAIVGVRGSRISATDGPYVETKEQLGGFCRIAAK